MSFIVTQLGFKVMVEAFINKTAPQTLVLRLFTNNLTPTAATVAADLTEMSGHSYASISLTPATWVTTLDGVVYNAQIVHSAYSTQTFTTTAGAGMVYGYYLTQTSSGICVGVERFVDGPYDMTAPGSIGVTPTIPLSLFIT